MAAQRFRRHLHCENGSLRSKIMHVSVFEQLIEKSRSCFKSVKSAWHGSHQLTTNRMRKLTFGSLFAGIGGFDLGFERAGMECRWQVEIDPYCQRVLAKHWPTVRRWDDVRTWPQPDTERVDVVCGGFPCQDVSSSGNRAGLGGKRSGLFYEFSRIICELRPRFVVMENVADLVVRGLPRVLGELAKIGYDAEWHCIPAADFGLPQGRDRIWIVANTHSERFQASEKRDSTRAIISKRPNGNGLAEAQRRARDVAPRECRVAHGVSKGVDRLRGLGNAVVPEVAEYIGRMIVASVDNQ